MSWVLFRLGSLATWECRFDEAMALLEESLDQSTAIKFSQGTLLAQLGLGEALHASGHERDAGSRFADALATARLLKEDTGISMALAGLASVAVTVGDLGAAGQWLDEPEARPANDVHRAVAARAAVLRARAALALACGEVEQAEIMLRQGLHMRRQLGDNRAIIEEVEAVAVVRVRRADDKRAAMLLGATDKWRSALGFPVPPRDQQARSEALTAIAARGATFDSAWEAGRELSLEDAITLALGAGDDQG